MRLALAIIASLTATPSTAHIWGGPTDGELPAPPSFEIGTHHGTLRQSSSAIREAKANGQITRNEARELKREHNRIAAAGRRMARDGLSPSEQRELEHRALILQGQINARKARRPTGS